MIPGYNREQRDPARCILRPPTCKFFPNVCNGCSHIGEMKPKTPSEIIAGDAWHKVCGKSNVVQTSTSRQLKRSPVQRIPVLVLRRSDDDRDHPVDGAVTAAMRGSPPGRHTSRCATAAGAPVGRTVAIACPPPSGLNAPAALHATPACGPALVDSR